MRWRQPIVTASRRTYFSRQYPRLKPQRRPTARLGPIAAPEHRALPPRAGGRFAICRPAWLRCPPTTDLHGACSPRSSRRTDAGGRDSRVACRERNNARAGSSASGWARRLRYSCAACAAWSQRPARSACRSSRATTWLRVTCQSSARLSRTALAPASRRRSVCPALRSLSGCVGPLPPHWYVRSQPSPSSVAAWRPRWRRGRSQRGEPPIAGAAQGLAGRVTLTTPSSRRRQPRVSRQRRCSRHRPPAPTTHRRVRGRPSGCAS